jgi:hypothetical protein
MNETTKQSEPHNFEEFEEYVNLFTLIPGGTGNGIVLLRKILDSIQSPSFRSSLKPVSFLIIGRPGSGRNLVSRALANSLALEDIRECPAKYLDNGINSSHFFLDSTPCTAHIITDVQEGKRTESVVWRYLKEGKCNYYNYMDGTFSKVIYCNGLIIMTANSKIAVPQTIVKATSHVVELEPYTPEQVKTIMHQILYFMAIQYQGEAVLNELIKMNPFNIQKSIELLKIAVNLMRAELGDYLTVELVNRSKRLCSEVLPPFGQDIPF